MSYLILYIVCSTIFAQSWRWSKSHGKDEIVMAAANYVTAACVSLTLAWGQITDNLVVWILASTTGIAYTLSLFVLMRCITMAGVGIASVITSCGVLIPVIVSWAYWDERLTLLQWSAICSFPIAVLLMRPRGTHETDAYPKWKRDLWLLALFLSMGGIVVNHKAVNVYAGPEYHRMYTAILFSFAALTNIVALAVKGCSFHLKDISSGVFIGLINIFGTLFTVLGLNVLPASLFLPTASCAFITLNLVIAKYVWKESLTRIQGVGILLALFVVAAINT